MAKNSIAIASDHAGVNLKNRIREFLGDRDIALIDLGTHSGDSVDYPDFAVVMAQALLAGNADLGVLICGTGIGMSIAANRYDHVRAALCSEPEVARLARQHNDANVLVLGARMIDEEVAVRCVEIFLETEFEGGRHGRRVEKLTNPPDLC